MKSCFGKENLQEQLTVIIFPTGSYFNTKKIDSFI